MARPLLLSLTAALALSSPPAQAQFEGRLDYVMKGLGGERAEAEREGWAKEGKMTLLVGPKGARVEIATAIPDGKGGSRPFKMVTLWRAAEPKKTLMLNEEQRTYSTMSTERAAGAARTKYKVERIGSGKVAGFGCQKVRITEEGESGPQEVCVTKDLGAVPAMLRMSADDEDDVFGELRRAGLEGIPVSWRSLDDDGSSVSMELVAAKKQKVPASTFAVPAGYRETGMAGVFATPEQQRELDAAMKQMQEQMKDMPPEQRKQMEEMMKKYGTGAK